VNDEPGTQASEATKPGSAATTCPRCGTPRTTGDRYCETCGHDFEAVAVAAPSWELLIEADREYHARFAGGGLEFPGGFAARSVSLDQDELRIGRRDGSAQEPDAAQLSGAADDPGLSRRHAILRRQDDGGYTIEDLGSTNGTEVNGRQIAAHEVIRLADGDRVLVGAWTSLSIRSRAACPCRSRAAGVQGACASRPAAARRGRSARTARADATSLSRR
jgi:hypothetical protein